jgi:hypothetical protein
VAFPFGTLPGGRQVQALARVRPSVRRFDVEIVPASRTRHSSALRPMPSWDRQVPRAPSHRLGVTLSIGASCTPSEGITPLSSLIRAHAPDPTPLSELRFPTRSSSLCRLLPAPAGRGPFPTLSLWIFSWMLGPMSRRLAQCSRPFLPARPRPSPYPSDGSASAMLRLKQFRAGVIFETVAIRNLRASRFAHHPDCPHTCRSSLPCGGGFYIRAEHPSLPSGASDMLVVRTGQLTT